MRTYIVKRTRLVTETATIEAENHHAAWDTVRDGTADTFVWTMETHAQPWEQIAIVPVIKDAGTPNTGDA